MSASFADVTSATITWDAVHALLRPLGFSNRTSFHQCPTECMFNFENGPEIETLPNASAFLGNTLNIWDNDSSLVCCVWRKTIPCRWLHYGVNEFLWVLIKLKEFFGIHLFFFRMRWQELTFSNGYNFIRLAFRYVFILMFYIFSYWKSPLNHDL
jgi:hypothetical protein